MYGLSAVGGGITTTIAQTPIALFGYELSDLRNRALKSIILDDTFTGLFREEAVLFSVATNFTGFQWLDSAAPRKIGDFGRSDISANKAMMRTLGIKRAEYVAIDAFVNKTRKFSGNLCVFGSPFTNNLANHMLQGGKPVLRLPSFGKSVRLAYRFSKSRNHSPLVRSEMGKSFSEESILIEGKDRSYHSNIDKDKRPLNGYLLLTKIPHPYLIGRFVFHVAGNTGPATNSFGLLLRGHADMTVEETEYLRNELNNSHAYQILFETTDLAYSHSESRDVFNKIELVKNSQTSLTVE